MIIGFLIIVQGFNTSLIPEYGTPPSKRHSSSMTYSSIHNSMIIFGGTDDTNFFNDVWVFNLATEVWSVLNPSSSVAPGK